MIPERTLRRNLRELPPAALVLFAGSFVNRFGSFVMTFLILYLTRRGFSPQQAGAAVSLYGLGGVVASVLGGELADRICRTRTITLSMFGSRGRDAHAILSGPSAGHLFVDDAGGPDLGGIPAGIERPAL